MTSLGFFFACLVFELSRVRANVVRRVRKCVLCVGTCTVRTVRMYSRTVRMYSLRYVRIMRKHVRTHREL